MDVPIDSGYLLLCQNVDRPGMIGRVGSLLGAGNANIASMQVGRREEEERALMVLGLDGVPHPATLARITELEDVFSVKVVGIAV